MSSNTLSDEYGLFGGAGAVAPHGNVGHREVVDPSDVAIPPEVVQRYG